MPYNVVNVYEAPVILYISCLEFEKENRDKAIIKMIRLLFPFIFYYSCLLIYLFLIFELFDEL